MEDMIHLAATLFAARGLDAASNHPRRRHRVPGGYLHVMDAAWPDGGVLGLKAYTTFRAGTHFHVLLYSAHDGRLLAAMEADYLGRIRTGAMSAVATDLLAPRQADTLAILGCGRQARTQVEAIAAVRRLREIHCYCRTPASREAFAREMARTTGCAVRACDTAEEAVRNAAIITTATTSREPVLAGEWLRPGIHINAIGANFPDRRELDDAAVRRADLIVVDDVPTAQAESGDLILAGVSWERVLPLAAFASGRVRWTRPEDAVTLFKSHGIALLDIGAAAYVYGRALEAGRGRPL
jgi:ornithine cyclodeaminase/alanine dehydrogenase-like protein (mu-crystallin family)